MFSKVISTESMPATAAEVYMAYSKFSRGQLQLMGSLIFGQGSPASFTSSIVAATPGAPPSILMKATMERILAGFLDGRTSKEEAAVTLEYLKMYRELVPAGEIESQSSGGTRNEPVVETFPGASLIVRSSIEDVSPEQSNQSVEVKGDGDATLSDFEREYLLFLEPTHAKSYLRDTKSAFKWLMENVGDIKLDDLNVARLEQLLAVEFGNSNHNAARFYRTLKAALNKAVSWHKLRSNPFVSFRLPKIPETTAPYVTEADLDALLAQKISKEYKILFTFALLTGMRLSEILNIKWISVDLVERIIKVMNDESFVTKGKKERIIPIADRLYDMLVDLHATAFAKGSPTYVFERRGKRFNGNYASRKFKGTIRRAGLDENLHFHSCRHGFATCLIQANVNPVHVQKLLGHANLATTLKYTHPGKDDLIAAIGKLGHAKAKPS